MRLFGLLAACAVVSCVSCAGSRGSPSDAHDRAVGDCSARSALRPSSRAGAGGAIALGELGGRTLAFVADEDDRVLHVLDVARHQEISTAPLAGTPAQVLITSDGRVLVTLRDASLVQVLVPRGSDGSLSARCTVPTPAEPNGIAESPDGATVVIASGWGHSLDVLRGAELTRAFRVDLPRDPRGVMIAADGTSAVVSHVTGSVVSVVDLRTGTARCVDIRGAPEERTITVGRDNKTKSRTSVARRSSIQGFALASVRGYIVEPRVLVDPGEVDEVPVYYGSTDRPTEIQDIALLDARLQPIEHAVTRSSERGARGERGDVDCRLPRAIAENTADHTALVTCLGSDTLVEYAIETGSAGPRAVARGRWPVARGPTGVAYDPKHAQAVVWSQFEHAVGVIALPTGSIEDRLIADKDRVTRWNLARPGSIERNGETEMGRELFHATNDPRLSREGLACASCHPDGRDDALTWATSDGPRQTPMLAGRLDGTAPYAWSGSSDRVAEHLEHTMQRLGGSGLKEREMKAIASYCLTMKTFSSPDTRANARAERGKAIFLSSAAGCSSCHATTKGVFTDQKKHDVASRTVTDAEATFDTPSLRFVGGTAPYFHDGRFSSLADLLRGTSGKMGKTSHLSPDDVGALEAYLRTL